MYIEKRGYFRSLDDDDVVSLAAVLFLWKPPTALWPFLVLPLTGLTRMQATTLLHCRPVNSAVLALA